MNAFHNAALLAAKSHNVLTADDRAQFAACSDDQALDGWAMLVVYDLSMRCRSFTPPVLDRLTELAREHGAIDDE